ncbi:MAG: tryptophan-rich sensory protein [Bacteroidota bacterium]|nr:tryptophan-rich sensory protein [Bacteroidota bacterium]
MNKYLKLTVCILIPIIVGSVSGWLSGSGMDEWFDTLNKPSFNPPSSVFGPVWSLLYLLMGISLYRVVQSQPGHLRNMALILFFSQLFLNFMWSLIFFRWHLLGTAFAEIVVLWLTIIVMLYYFSKLDKTAWLLQIPYLLWVTFAAFLSGTFWILNQ